MRLTAAAGLALMGALIFGGGALAQTPPVCGPPAEDRSGAYLQGEVGAGEAFSAPLAPGFGFVLEPVEAGWRIRVRDEAGLDLSTMTPPRFGPNPRDVLGWQFRDAQNRGPNDGSVNAPLRLRRVEFVYRVENHLSLFFVLQGVLGFIFYDHRVR